MDLVEVESGEILTLCGSFRGPKCRARLAFYPSTTGQRLIKGRQFEKASYETGYTISGLRKVLDLPGEQHFIVDRCQIVKVYRAAKAFEALSEKQFAECQRFIRLLSHFCGIEPCLHGLTGSGALHSIGPASDYDWVIYTRDPHPVQEFVTSHPEFSRELTFSMQHVYRKYSVFSGLSQSDLDLLFEARWKYFRFEGLRISISFVDPLFMADEFLSETAWNKQEVMNGIVANASSCYQMPRIISLHGENRAIFTWHFLYNGAFADTDSIQVAGRAGVINEVRYIVVEAPQDYIRKFPKRRINCDLSKIGVRLATIADTQMIINFLKTPSIDQSFTYPLSARNNSIEERVHRMFLGGFWLIALHHGEVVGCRGCTGILEEEPGMVVFSTLAVGLEFRGIGLGTLLVCRGVQIAKERYAPHFMRLDSWSTNIPLAKTVAKAGFVEGRRFDDPLKRPPGIQSIEYLLDCSKLNKTKLA